ncbi:protein FAN [Cephus cinctus]|uniref:Protein FAN n=1 Tax=Cephus cinctus TaxID=211228 RepID=A0AAJ7CDH5_CEPCN|nr:protein FAN [Cephus cinctus]
MTLQVMDKERFTMLLLEPGEIFFEDYSVQMKSPDCANSVYNNWIEGRLKLCSKSLVFVDKDINRPLIKVQLKETLAIEKLNSDDTSKRCNDVLSIHCKQYVEMLEGNILAPYKFIHKTTCFLFSFNYAKVDECLPHMLQLLRATTLPTAEQNAMIMAIVHSRQSRVSFDTSWLEDLYEQVVLEVHANKVLPLVINPGKVLLTTCRIYFQPYNNMDQHPVLKINLKDIKYVIKRRFLLRQVGIEIKWTKNPGSIIEYLFLSVKCQETRDDLYEKLISQPAVSLEKIAQNQMTIQWQNGSLSNYDYLLYVNSLADRTFHDLTQYPVMPWVIQDYTSSTLDLNNPNVYRDLTKPIGALEPTRLERLKERYMEMSEPKFLYGSHYSAPGFVLFYLVRKYPQYMLCLQNGRFDHPDRMFNSVADVWKNVLLNMSDFKELVPEFYDTNNGGDFLVNTYGIDFGYRHDGRKIGDVQLPPWADGPVDFVQQLRNALESDYVSQNLHNWIDLIFGYKQKGIEAEKADNMFFHLCYEGAIDLDTIQDINDRHGLEVQIMEFGQIPKQVFTLRHPKRMVSGTSSLMRSVSSISSQGSSCTECESVSDKDFTIFKKLSKFQSHKQAVNSVLITNDSTEDIVSVGQDGMLKLYSMKSGKLTRSVALSTLPLSSCVAHKSSAATPNTFTVSSNFVVAGCWDNTLIFYDVEFGRVIDTLQGHEDAVSCLTWSPSRGVLVSGSWDCTAKVWRSPSSTKKIKPAECLLAQLDHDSKVVCLDISSNDSLLVSGTEDGEIFLWNMDKYNLQFTVKAHTAKLNAMRFDPQSKTIVSCANDKVLNIIDVRTSTQLYRTILEDEPISLYWKEAFLLVGDISGNLSIWDLRGAILCTNFHCHHDAVTSIAVSQDGKRVVTGSKDRSVTVWDCNWDWVGLS